MLASKLISVNLLDRIFNTCDQYQAFTKKLLRKKLNICSKDNIFDFKDKLCKQIDGAPMGRGAFPLHWLTCFCLIMKKNGWMIVQKNSSLLRIGDTSMIAFCFSIVKLKLPLSSNISTLNILQYSSRAKVI